MIELCDEKEPFLLDDYRVGEKIEEYARRQEQAKDRKSEKKKNMKPETKVQKTEGAKGSAIKSGEVRMERAPDSTSGAAGKD